MNKVLMVVPAIIIALFASLFYVSFASKQEVAHKEEILKDVRAQSYELEEMFRLHTKLLLNLNKNINNDEVSKSFKDLKRATHYYLNTLSSLEQERLYTLSKIIKKKFEALELINEDIKTDRALLKNAVIWSVSSYESYVKNLKHLSSADKSYMINLFKATVDDSYSEFVNLNATKYTDNLNSHLQKIYKKQQSLVELEKALAKNSILHEVNEVVNFAYKRSTELRDELNATTNNLLVASMVLLVLSILVYIKEVRSMQDLARAKSELREFVFALEESAIVSKTDLKGRITYVNNKFCEVSGYDEEELIGKPHNIVRHPDMKASVFEELWDTIKYGGVFHGTIKNRKKDGSAYYVDTTIIPLHNEKGEIDEYLAVRYDVTKFIQEV